jgi:hypothetical protein
VLSGLSEPDAGGTLASLRSLISQRVIGLALGYEDLNDHDQLRHDPLIATLVDKADPTRALAGKSTLNRLELTPEGNGEDRYKRIVYDTAAIDRFFVDAFLQAYPKAPERIVLDLDTTDDEIHGGQEGRFFHGYYRSYCYLPLYIFSGEHLLCARLRQANVGPAEGTLEELERIVTQIRTQWPDVKLVIRADSAFSRDDIMSWCEKHGVDYVLGLARNARLERIMASEMEQSCAESKRTGLPFRSYKDFEYQTLDSWSRSRRVVGKAEYLIDKPNARFVVTSLPIEEVDRQTLYENEYCGRGDMENRIKEQKSSHIGGHHARESTAALVLLGSLSDDERSSQAGAQGHGTGQSAMRFDPAQAVQNRSTNYHHLAQDLDLAIEQLSAGQPLCPGLRQSRQPLAVAFAPTTLRRSLPRYSVGQMRPSIHRSIAFSLLSTIDPRESSQFHPKSAINFCFHASRERIRSNLDPNHLSRTSS